MDRQENELIYSGWKPVAYKPNESDVDMWYCPSSNGQITQQEGLYFSLQDAVIRMRMDKIKHSAHMISADRKGAYADENGPLKSFYEEKFTDHDTMQFIDENDEFARLEPYAFGPDGNYFRVNLRLIEE